MEQVHDDTGTLYINKTKNISIYSDSFISLDALFIGNSGHSFPDFFVLGIFVLLQVSIDPGFICDLQGVWHVLQVNFVDEAAGCVIEDAKETILGEGQEDGIGSDKLESLDGAFLGLETAVASFLEQVVRFDHPGKIGEDDEADTLTSRN